jgi:hypothetical protein
VPHGDVVFVDVDPHVAPVAGKITNGDYAFSSKPGKKRVEIRSFRLSDRKTPEGRPIGEMYIPERYNLNSELTAEVTLDGDNNFDFDLKP